MSNLNSDAHPHNEAGLITVCLKNSSEILKYFDRPELVKAPFFKGVSRLDYKPDYFKFNLHSESIKSLLNTPNSNLNWEECCAKRARELQLLDKKNYYISYSGGIDSTCLMASLIKFWPEDFKKRITVLLSISSIQENPNFFNKFIINFNLRHILQDPSSLLMSGDSILLTGELGDQLFGSDILGRAVKEFGNACLKYDYRTWVPKIIADWTRREESGIPIFERLEPIVNESPVPIKNTHDFFWWFNFTQKWQYVKYRYAAPLTWNLGAQYGTHVLHFFDSIDFQQWSLNNHDLKIKGTWDSYKFTSKEFIYSLTKHSEDLNLIKVQSLAKTFTFYESRLALDDSHNSIDTISELEKYVR